MQNQVIDENKVCNLWNPIGGSRNIWKGVQPLHVPLSTIQSGKGGV